MKKLILLLSLVSLLNNVSAQSRLRQANQAQQEINRRGEVYFSFKLDDLTQLTTLTNEISISNLKGDTIFAYANQKEFLGFSNKNIDFKVLTAPSELYAVHMSNDSKQLLTWNYYPTYPGYVSLMQQFAADNPAICSLITIATLPSGRKILALKISDNVNIEENEPEFLYSSSIHGNETAGYILLLHLADSLLSGYGSSTRITDLVNNCEIVICPLANPDGTYAGGNSTVNGATRYNANNIDLNRNYPDPDVIYGQHPDGENWQPETVAFMDFARKNTFTMGANFHGGIEVVNYPWDTWPRLSADNAWWVYTSREYADTVHLHAPAGYMDFMNNGITNGFAWYYVHGSRQDYMNYFHHCRESTIELSNDFILPVSQLIPYWNYNSSSLLNYIEQAGYGMHGLVTDSLSGEPLLAKVYISDFDKDSSYVYTDPQVGDYHRLLKGGSYTVIYSASGYLSKTIPVTVSDRKTTLLNVKLLKGTLSTNQVDDGHNVTEIQAGIKIYPNPVIDGSTTIYSENPVQIFQIRDITGKIVSSSFPLKNTFSVACNWPAGIYFFQFKVKNNWISKKITIP